MSLQKTETIISSSPKETLSLARRLAEGLRPGCVLALIGPLGSGKTLFVKGLARGLGLSARVATSPTFTIIHEYDGQCPLFHVDLYRLDDPREVAELGLEEYFDREGVVALEWSEKAQGQLPDRTITVQLDILGPRQRMITIYRP